MNYLTGIKARLAEAALFAGIVYGALEYKTGKASGLFYIQHFGEYLIVAHTFALMLVAFKRWDAALAESALMRPFLFLGGMSYSVYLSHYLPVITLSALLAERWGITDPWRVLLITTPLCLAVMLPVAWVFHVLVERRFLNAPHA